MRDDVFFNGLCTPFFPIEILFSGKLPYTTITIIAESLTLGASSLERTLGCKYLK